MRTHNIPLCYRKSKRSFIKPPDLAQLSTLIGSNYPCLELIYMVPKVFEPLKFDCISFHIITGVTIMEEVCYIWQQPFYLLEDLVLYNKALSLTLILLFASGHKKKVTQCCMNKMIPFSFSVYESLIRAVANHCKLF